MKLYAPKYYETFQCIAEKCKHNCCIGWEIDIDDDTLENYHSLNCGYAKYIIDSIDYTDTPHFVLDNNKRCPHLNCENLCQIILNCGENYLCEICKEHPRFYHETNHGLEVGLGIACEEACRIVLSSDDFDKIIVIGEVEGKEKRFQHSVLSQRRLVYKILKDNSLDLTKKMETIYGNYDISIDDSCISPLMQSLEYLDPLHIDLFTSFSAVLSNQTKEYEDILTRLYGYLIYRHCSDAKDYFDFRNGLCLASFCIRLMLLISDISNVYSIARILSEEIEYSKENTEKIRDYFTEHDNFIQD